MSQREQAQSLEGMKIQMWDLNAKLFLVIPVIACEVMGISEISYSRYPPLYTTRDFFSLTSILRDQFLEGDHLGRSPLLSTPERHFSHTKTFRVIPCRALRKIWSFGIISEKVMRISRIGYQIQIAPFQDKSGTKLSRSKALKLSPCHGVSKIWSSGIIRQRCRHF
ncbi:hypothetical protein TNCV_1930291 [Trichonephila clavipes]|nr:hypothetical protein TNCV_1930291 [Trichonephila clavipes]